MPSPASSVPEPRTPTQATYGISGMTCDHCVRAVTAELRALPGVIDVTVRLDPGTATVSSTEPLAPQAIQAAVAEAGYQLAQI
jgi:copper chaperone CopZ